MLINLVKILMAEYLPEKSSKCRKEDGETKSLVKRGRTAYNEKKENKNV